MSQLCPSIQSGAKRSKQCTNLATAPLAPALDQDWPRVWFQLAASVASLGLFIAVAVPKNHGK